MSFIGDLLGGGSGKDAAKAATKASDAQLQFEQQALDYLKSINAVPQQVSEQALKGLSGYFQVPGQQLSQDELLKQAMASPLYKTLMDSQGFGEDAIMRNAAATGGLRSGNTQADLYKYDTQLRDNAILQAFNEAQGRQDAERQLNLSGLQSLAGVPTNANSIASLMTQMGQTTAQGITGAAQARQAGSQNVMNNILGLGNLGLQYMAFSDIRLKRNIRFAGRRNGHNWYVWEWIPEAKQIGLEGESEGVLAHEVYEIDPKAVALANGFLFVNYERLGLREAA